MAARTVRRSQAGGILWTGRVSPPANPANDEHFGAKALCDLDLSYEPLGGVRLAVGGNNIFNTYPDEQVKVANVSNGRFIYSCRVTQFGMNGGFYYARLQLTL